MLAGRFLGFMEIKNLIRWQVGRTNVNQKVAAIFEERIRTKMDNWSIVACKSLFLERILRGIWEAWAWNLDDFWFWTMQATCDLQSCIWYKFGLVIYFSIVLETFESVNCATKLSLDGTNCIWKYFWTCKYFFEFLWWRNWNSVRHKIVFCGLWLSKETPSVVRKP